MYIQDEEFELETRVIIAHIAIDICADRHNLSVDFILDNDSCIPEDDLFYEKMDEYIRLDKKLDKLKASKLQVLKEIGD